MLQTIATLIPGSYVYGENIVSPYGTVECRPTGKVLLWIDDVTSVEVGAISDGAEVIAMNVINMD